jgi:hypothetical protein
MAAPGRWARPQRTSRPKSRTAGLPLQPPIWRSRITRPAENHLVLVASRRGSDRRLTVLADRGIRQPAWERRTRQFHCDLAIIPPERFRIVPLSDDFAEQAFAAADDRIRHVSALAQSGEMIGDFPQQALGATDGQITSGDFFTQRGEVAGFLAPFDATDGRARVPPLSRRVSSSIAWQGEIE